MLEQRPIAVAVVVVARVIVATAAIAATRARRSFIALSRTTIITTTKSTVVVVVVVVVCNSLEPLWRSTLAPRVVPVSHSTQLAIGLVVPTTTTECHRVGVRSRLPFLLLLRIRVRIGIGIGDGRRSRNGVERGLTTAAEQSIAGQRGGLVVLQEVTSRRRARRRSAFPVRCRVQVRIRVRIRVGHGTTDIAPEGELQLMLCAMRLRS